VVREAVLRSRAASEIQDSYNMFTPVGGL